MKRVLTIGLSVLLFAAAGLAQAKTGEQLLQRFVSDVKTFEANFTQQVFGEDGKLSQTTNGALMLSRPGKFKWNYALPYPQEIIADGKNLWIHDVELEQVTVKPITEILTSTPFALLTSETALRENFILEEIGNIKGLTWVRLRPLVVDTDFTGVEIGLDNKAVKVMFLYDQFGQKTVIEFKDVKTNHRIPKKAYQFKPPKGVDVIGEPS